MKLKAYPRTKPSGVEWLGDIPEHWGTRRLKDVGILHGGAGFPHDEQGVEDEELPFYKVGDLKASLDGRVMGNPEHTISNTTAKKLGALIIPPDSVVYAKIGAALLLNRRRITFVQCCIDNNMTAYVPDRRHIQCEWAFYWLSTLDFGEFMNPGAVPSFSEGYQSILPILVPPLREQRAIAAFLNRETGRIDRLVAKKRELIDRLKEKRTALISRTVTRGLPRADELFRKHSGIEWLGDVPKHWEIVPLGYLVRFTGGATPDKSNSAYWDGSIPWVSPKDMKVPRISDAEDHVSPEALANSALRLLPVDSVLIVVRGMILAHSFPVALTTAPVTINQDMKAVACGNRVTPHFLSWSFIGFAKTFVSFADESAHGTRKLETATLTGFPFLLPPLSEQVAIAEYLDQETAKLDALVLKVEEAVERLQECRNALITAAVTGKIDLRK